MLRTQQPEDLEVAAAEALGFDRDDEEPWSKRETRRRTTMFLETAGFLRPAPPDADRDFLSLPQPRRDESFLRLSRQSSFSATDAVLPSYTPRAAYERRDSDMSMLALERVTETANAARAPTHGVRRLAPGEKVEVLDSKGDAVIDVEPPALRPMSFLRFVRTFYPLIPRKGRMFLGFFFAVTTGAATPLFSSFVSQLLLALTPGNNVDQVKVSLIVLAIAGLDGLSQGVKYTLLQQVAMSWITLMRERAFGRLIVQDKAWFDEPANTTTALVNSIVKDAEDARNVVGLVIGQAIAVVVMVGMGLIWALIVGWELTLVGFAVAPVCMVGMFITSILVNKYEARNKLLREHVSKKFHEVRAAPWFGVDAADAKGRPSPTSGRSGPCPSSPSSARRLKSRSRPTTRPRCAPRPSTVSPTPSPPASPASPRPSCSTSAPSSLPTAATLSSRCSRPFPS
jgi:hypothetical protein